MGDGGGKGLLAYQQWHGFPGSPQKRWIATCRVVSYDCYGKPFGKMHEWLTPGGRDGAGNEVKSVIGYGRLGSPGQCKSPGTKDKRTLKMMLEGCCPPELMKDFIMTEDGALAEADAAEEALKLHKRGYLGGGE